MKKKDWGNATWYLFHTLAQKLKPEYASVELPVLFEHIESICNNLPCPDCQEHARSAMLKANKRVVISSKENFINFLWTFHNNVNLRTKKPFYPKESLEMYNRAVTPNVVKNFINVMSQSINSTGMMINTFHRQRFIKQFIQYINNNYYKYA
jgi:hypothetical protein